jgi:hypothetical protein
VRVLGPLLGPEARSWGVHCGHVGSAEVQAFAGTSCQRRHRGEPPERSRNEGVAGSSPAVGLEEPAGNGGFLLPEPLVIRAVEAMRINDSDNTRRPNLAPPRGLRRALEQRRQPAHGFVATRSRLAFVGALPRFGGFLSHVRVKHAGRTPASPQARARGTETSSWVLRRRRGRDRLNGGGAIRAARLSRRRLAEPRLRGLLCHRLVANWRGASGATVSADQARAWLRLPLQTPPRMDAPTLRPREASY